MEFKNVEFPPSRLNEYSKTADFVVVINKYIIINLEFNNMPFKNVKNRNYMYLTKMISLLLNAGDKPSKIKKYQVYQVNLNASLADKNVGIRDAKCQAMRKFRS